MRLEEFCESWLRTYKDRHKNRRDRDVLFLHEYEVNKKEYFNTEWLAVLLKGIMSWTDGIQ